MTLVFLVRPKFSQPWDEQFFPCCIICSVLVLRAQLVIRKQDVSDDSLLLCSSLQAPEVEPARRQSCIWPVFPLGSHGRHQSPWLRILYWRASEREHSLVLRRSLLERILTRLRHVQNFNHYALIRETVLRSLWICWDSQTSPLSSTSRLCLPYRRPWSGQQRSQRGRYSTHGIFYLQSSWKLWSVCNITGEGWTESLLLVEVCAVFP